MKNLFLRSIATALACVSLLLVGALPATADPSVADLAASVTSSPAVVSPVGGIALHRARATNNGPAAAPADLRTESTGGSLVLASSQIPSDCSAPADGTADPVVTCRFAAMLPGSSSPVVAIALQTPETTGTVRTTATASIPPELVGTLVDTTPGNDTATVETPVTNDPNGSAALLQEGETLTFQRHILTVRASVNGVIASMNVALSNGGICGLGPCDDGVRVDFDTDANYQGSLGLYLDFGRGNPCRGIGGGASCADLFMRKNGLITKVPLCSGAVPPSPCIEQVGKNGPSLNWTLRLDSTDPEFLPPLNQGSGS